MNSPFALIAAAMIIATAFSPLGPVDQDEPISVLAWALADAAPAGHDASDEEPRH